MSWWWRGHRHEDQELGSHDTPRKEDTKSESATTGEHILNLQRTVGNRAVQRMVGATGEPLGEEQRRRLEASFGQDLSAVRVHRDAESEELASAAGADAFTTGRDIYFAPGKYSPEALAHEVGHTIQQQGALQASGGEDSGLEHEAQSAGRAAVAGQRAELSRPAAAPAMQRQKAAGVDATPKSSLPFENVTVDNFEIDSAELKKPQQERLDALAKTLQDLPATAPDSFVTITGFADAPGTAEHNAAVGQQRADAVLNYLVAHGAPAAMLSASSLGEAALSVDTKQYEPRNRRVEINVFRRNFFAAHRPMLGPFLTLTPSAPPPEQKPLDIFNYHPQVHIPTKEEEDQERERQNQRNADRAHEILKREAEEAERHPPGSSVSDFFGKKGRELAKALGLPKFVQDKAESLAKDLPGMGVKAIFDQIAADKGMDDATKNAVHSIIDALAKEKVK
jgi:outer membrane protein OmpA-like peptidoglycan-associated protein